MRTIDQPLILCSTRALSVDRSQGTSARVAATAACAIFDKGMLDRHRLDLQRPRGLSGRYFGSLSDASAQVLLYMYHHRLSRTVMLADEQPFAYAGHS